MPEVDGLTLVKFFRAHPNLKDIPLIVPFQPRRADYKGRKRSLSARTITSSSCRTDRLIARIRHHSQGYINLLQRNEAYQALLKSEQRLAWELARAAEYVTSLLPKPTVDARVCADWRIYPFS